MTELRLTKDGKCFVPLRRRGVKQINVEIRSQVKTPMYAMVERVGTYDVVIELRPVKKPKTRRRRIVGAVKRPFKRRKKKEVPI